MICRRFFYLFLLLAGVWVLTTAVATHHLPAESAAASATAITINGTVTGPGGPVADVWIAFSTDQDWQTTTTNSSGQYTVTIEGDVGGFIAYNLRPAVADRLAQINWASDIPATGYTQDFTLTEGRLLEVTIPDGDGRIWFDVHPLFHPRAEGTWYELDWRDPLGLYQAVLPPDAYHLITRNHPPGTFITTETVDLRLADQSLSMPLNLQWVSPFPTQPPDADKISFSPLNGLAEATITGAPGAVLPLANVLLINVKTGHQAFVQSESDGSFTAQLFAPPGSHISVRHGPANWHWSGIESIGAEEGLNMFPSVVVYRPHTHTASPGYLPFASTGVSHYDWGTPRTIGGAWTLQGQMESPPSLSPGDSVQIISDMVVYSQAIDAGTDVDSIDIRGYVDLYMIYDQYGRPVQTKNYNGSNRLTPTGLPIIHEQHARIYLDSATVANLFYSGGHTLTGFFGIDLTLPSHLPPGIYRPAIYFVFENTPISDEWAAATLEIFTYELQQAVLPPLTVIGPEGPPDDDPLLIWRILMNTVSQGQRGTGSSQDAHLYGAASFIVTQDAPYVVPAVDPESGASIAYRLDPFLPMIGYTDRSTPSTPLIPFVLDDSELCVEIEKPDGSIDNLGCEAFAQAGHHTPTTRGGHELNVNSEQVMASYQLQVASDRFVTTFDQDGHHIIRLSGDVYDAWGNRYTGGGDYDVWVARSLDMTPGVLPGTPLAVGDAFNPALHLDPGVAADVTLTVTHYPLSDPAQKQIFTVAGQANRFGYFSAGNPVVLNDPGEYRVDLTASYWDEDGRFWMGAASWGGIVMTPAADGQLVAHGRRGFDSLDYIPNQWFINCVTDPPAPTPHTAHMFNPYFNGDVIWSRPEYDAWDSWGLSCDGESLRLVASLQDTVGNIESDIQSRAAHMNLEPLFYVPLADRYVADELPVFTSTSSGLPPHMGTGDEEMIAYAYFSSQRPGVRVRETVAEEGPTLQSGYWRLDTLYDYQQGVGVEGDLPHDFKFQYVGIVYRDLQVNDYAEYVGHGSGWIHIDQEDATGTRVMPPFAGPGNGGWTTQGGPLLTIKGEEIHQFLHLTGVKPGDILEVGDRFHLAGHLMPTLPSRVQAVITSPNGTSHTVSGQANAIGYFYDRLQDFTVDEPGLWSVDVTVWHDSPIGTGEMVDCDPATPFDPARPCPSGHVLGSDNGRFHVYVVEPASEAVRFFNPLSGFLDFPHGVTPVAITGPIPAGWSNVTVDYTIRMPGVLLVDEQVSPAGTTFSFDFDPVALHHDFPNLDLTARDEWQAGLADTFTITVLVQGEQGGRAVQRAGHITIQANELFVRNITLSHYIYLPGIMR